MNKEIKSKKAKEPQIIDFSKIELVDLAGDTFCVDLSKSLGNLLYQTTGDLGMFNFAQKVYKEGKAEVTEEIKAELKMLLKNPQCPFIVLVKKKLLEMLM